MKKKIRITTKQFNALSFAYRVGGFALIVGLLLGYSFLIGKPIEFALIFLPYFVTKGFYSRQWHASSLKQCFVLSLVIFAFLTTIALPKEYSISVAFVLGLLAAEKAAAQAARIQQLELQQALCGVVRYPMSATYNAGYPFNYGCGCGCGNI